MNQRSSKKSLKCILSSNTMSSQALSLNAKLHIKKTFKFFVYTEAVRPTKLLNRKTTLWLKFWLWIVQRTRHTAIVWCKYWPISTENWRISYCSVTNCFLTTYTRDCLNILFPCCSFMGLTVYNRHPSNTVRTKILYKELFTIQYDKYLAISRLNSGSKNR